MTCSSYVACCTLINSCVRETLNLWMYAISSNNTKKEEKYVTCHLSSVTCHLTTTLCSFSCFESHRMLGDGAEGALVIDRVTNKISAIKFYVMCNFLLKTTLNAENSNYQPEAFVVFVLTLVCLYLTWGP